MYYYHIKENPMKRSLFSILSFLAMLTLLTATQNSAAETKLKAAGCKTEGILMDELCKNYKDAKIKPGKTGNKKALLLFADDKIDFAFTCKPSPKLVKKFKIDPAKAADWKCIAFAKDPIAVVVNPDTGITDLTPAQLSSIYAGQTANWKELGGNDLPINVGYMDSNKVETGNNTVFKECTMELYIDPAGKISGEKNKSPNKKVEFTKKATILDSPDKLGNFVKAKPGAIAFMGLNSYKKKFGTAIKVSGVEPTIETVRSGEYPMAVTYHLVFNESGSEDVKKFIDFALSDEGKKITSNNFIAIDAKEVK